MQKLDKEVRKWWFKTERGAWINLLHVTAFRLDTMYNRDGDSLVGIVVKLGKDPVGIDVARYPNKEEAQAALDALFAEPTYTPYIKTMIIKGPEPDDRKQTD